MEVQACVIFKRLRVTKGGAMDRNMILKTIALVLQIAVLILIWFI